MANPGAFRNERSLHWDYFLSLEEDLLRSVRFVEPDRVPNVGVSVVSPNARRTAIA